MQIGKKTGRWIGAEYRGVEAPQISCSEYVDPEPFWVKDLHLLQSAHGAES